MLTRGRQTGNQRREDFSQEVTGAEGGKKTACGERGHPQSQTDQGPPRQRAPYLSQSKSKPWKDDKQGPRRLLPASGKK